MSSSNGKYGYFNKPNEHSPHKKMKNKASKEATVELSYNWPRDNLFDKQWNLIESKLHKLTSGLFGQYVERLYKFVSMHIEMKKHGQTQMLIPTAIIALSSKYTQKRVSHEIDFLLNEKDADIKIITLESHQGVNINTLFQTIFRSFNGENRWSSKKGKPKSCSFSDVMDRWLDQQCDVDSDHRPAIGFVFQEFESFNKEVLHSLVSILKDYTDRINIVFIFMIYNQGSSTQYTLPTQITDCLLLEDIPPFYEPKLLPHILKELVIDPDIPFKIHPSLIKEIDLIFSNYEFSFSHFFLFIKSLVFDHFYTNPLSAVYSLKSLTGNAELEEVYRNSVNIDFGNDGNYMKNVYSSYLNLLKEHEEFCINLEILQSFRKLCLHEEPYKFITLYSDILCGKFDLKGYLFQLLKVKELSFITAINKIWDDFQDFQGSSLMKKLANFRMDLDNHLAKESEENEKQELSVKKLGLDYDGVVQTTNSKLRGLNARLELRRSLLTSISDSNKLSPAEKLKMDFIQDLVAEFEGHSLFDQKELVDCFFYNNSHFLHSVHSISIRDKTNAAFGMKYSSNNMADNIVLYRLYKEAGKNIDLLDMFKEFCDERELNVKQNESIVHFSNSFADLEFIGVVQPSRKAHLFNKIVWL